MRFLTSYICLFLCLFLMSDVSAQSSLSEGSLKQDAKRLGELDADESLRYVYDLIDCRFLPITDEQLESAIERAERSQNVAAIKVFEESAPKCIGLTDEDFYKVESILKKLSNEGVTQAQLIYWRYVSPPSENIRWLSDPSLGNAVLFKNSERFLRSAAKQGDYSAFLFLAELNFSGELSARDYVKSAAYLAAYEGCTGQTAPIDTDVIYSSVKGHESVVARNSRSLMREMNCK